MTEATRQALEALGADGRRRRPVRRPPGQRADHRGRGRTSSACRATAWSLERRPRGQHVLGLDPARALRRPSADGRLRARRHRRAGRLRRRLRLGRRRHRPGRSASMPARDEGCALVTGGTRGIGAAIAERLRGRRLDGRDARAARAGDVQRRRRRDARRRRAAAFARGRASASARCSCSSTTPACAATGWPSACPTTDWHARDRHEPHRRLPLHAAARCDDMLQGPLRARSSTSPRSSPSARTRARPTTSPPRPACSASRETVAREMARNAASPATRSPPASSRPT